MSDLESESDILAFRQMPKPADGTVRIGVVREKAFSKPRCEHRSITVRRESRRVRCSQCDVELDPIQVLIDMAYKSWEVEMKFEALKKENTENQAILKQQQERDRFAAQKLIDDLEPNTEVAIDHLLGERKMVSSMSCTILEIHDDHLMVDCVGKPERVEISSIVRMRRRPKQRMRRGYSGYVSQ